MDEKERAREARSVTPPMAAAARPGAPGGLAALKARLKDAANAALAPVVRALLRLSVRPDHLTVAGLGFSLVAGLAFFEGGFRLGALLVAVSGLFDILDGQLARARGVPSRFGAFLDSTLDRLAESAILAGIVGYYVARMFELVLDPETTVAQIRRGLEPNTYAVLALTGTVALVGSFMVSYTRARAEGLGLECRVGWFERPERLLLVIVAGALGVGPVMPAALILLAVLSFVTTIQRGVHVWKITRGAGRDA
jgi:CDP-diacylglycerol--glycerol-3-phosphate 3-phosphatidyltransferase